MLKFILVRALPLLIFAASCQPSTVKKTTVEGMFHDGEGAMLILQEMDINEIHSIDSVTVLNGTKFIFNIMPVESGFWLLKAPSGKILVILLHPGDQVKLSGSMQNFPDNVILHGSGDAMLLNEFYRYTRKNESQADSLDMLLAESQDSPDYYRLTQKFDTVFRMIWERQRLSEKAFINGHPGSLASLVVINYAFGLSTVLNPGDDLACFIKLDSALMKNYPENKHVKFHHQRVMEFGRKKSAGN